MKFLFASVIASALMLPLGTALASPPADPNCLGTDVAGLAQIARPFGQNVVGNFTEGGFGDEVLGHLQGVPEVSTRPDDGFPRHTP